LGKIAYVTEYKKIYDLHEFTYVRSSEIRFHLNLGESHHSLAEFLFFGEYGDLRRQDYYQQMNKISCLSLLINAVVCWNSLKLQNILENFKKEGKSISKETLRHVTPMLHSHINPYGEYRFDVD
jgi:TnpA family transposase